MSSNIACPCCGNYTIDGTITPITEICPVCFWQFDVVAQERPEKVIGPNKMSLQQAIKNYSNIGAISEKNKAYVRAPKSEELPENN